MPLSLSSVPFFNRVLQRLCTNGVMWKRLRHPNVVDFLGFGSDSHPISLVYPWMTNGNLSEYLRKRPDADKLGLVCSRLSTVDNLVDNILDDTDLLSMLVIGYRSRFGLPTSV